MKKYCYQCLRKAKGKTGTHCPCGAEWRVCKNKRTRASTVTRLANLRGGKQPTASSQYETYMRSELWKRIRHNVLTRDNAKCCCCNGKATNVHHRDYDSATMSGDALHRLVSICRKCHRDIHRDANGKRHGVRDTEQKLESMAKWLPLQHGDRVYFEAVK